MAPYRCVICSATLQLLLLPSYSEAFTIRNHPTTVTAGQFESLVWTRKPTDPLKIQLAEVDNSGRALQLLGAPFGNGESGTLPVIFVNSDASVEPVTIVGFDLGKIAPSGIVNPSGPTRKPFFIDSHPITVIPSTSGSITQPVPTASTTKVEATDTSSSEASTSIPTTTEEPQNSNAAAIAGGVIGSLAALIVISFSVFWFIRYRKNRSPRSVDLTPFFETVPSSTRSNAVRSTPSTRPDKREHKWQINTEKSLPEIPLEPQRRVSRTSLGIKPLGDPEFTQEAPGNPAQVLQHQMGALTEKIAMIEAGMASVVPPNYKSEPQS